RPSTGTSVQNRQRIAISQNPERPRICRRPIRPSPAGTVRRAGTLAGWSCQGAGIRPSKGKIMENLILKRGLWVVVADGEKALFLKNEGDAKFPDFQLVQEMAQDNPATRDQGAERPGRHSDGPSPHRSAYADTDWHRLNKQRFADDIA